MSSGLGQTHFDLARHVKGAAEQVGPLQDADRDAHGRLIAVQHLAQPPGIDRADPERTDTSNGSGPAPKVFPVAVSSFAT